MTSRSLPTDGFIPPQLRRAAPYYALALAVLFFYGNVYDNALLYDDEHYILKNEYLRSFHSLGAIFGAYIYGGAFYRPLQNVLYLIVYQMGGLNLFGFHFLNIALHIANACLVYTLGCKLRFDTHAAFIGALLWALHPVHTEAVTYMSATADTLFAFFCLLGLVILPPDFTTRKFLIIMPVYVLGLLSKETAIVFPLLVMCSIYLMQADRFRLRPYLRTWPLWLISIFYMGCRQTFVVLGGMKFTSADPTAQAYAAHIATRLYTFFATVPAYLRILVWPVGLHMDHDFPAYPEPWHWKVGLGAMLVAATVAQIWWGRGKRGLPLSWGLMWFACAQIPQTGILMPINSLFYEHWMYLPSAGLFLGVAQTVVMTVQNVPMRIGMAAGYLMALILGVMTYRQNEVWRDPVTFYTYILSYGESSVREHNNLGVIYMERGDYDLAMQQFRLAGTMPEAHHNMASLYSQMPDSRQHVQEEISELKRVLEMLPNSAPDYDTLASVYDSIGDPLNAHFYRWKAEEIRKKSSQ